MVRTLTQLSVKKAVVHWSDGVCRGYVSMLGCKGNLTHDQKAKPRGIHMATKSRSMKTLRDFKNQLIMQSIYLYP